MRGRGCQYVAARYDEVESLILHNVPRLKPELVLPNKDDALQRRNQLRARLEELDNEIQDVERKLSNLDDAFSETEEKSIRIRLQAKMIELNQKLNELQELRTATEQELESAETDQRSYREWQADLVELCKNLGADDPMLRSRVRSHLQSIISKIEVFTRGHTTEWDNDLHDGDDLREYVREYSEGSPKAFARQAKGFIKYALGKRMSPYGRFVRVWYGENFVDLVPEGSIATGLRDRKWQRPNLQQLWRDYERESK